MTAGDGDRAIAARVVDQLAVAGLLAVDADGRASVHLSGDALRAIVHALYDYKMETDRYLGRWKPHQPEDTDLCCDTHLAKWRYQEEIHQDLARRLTLIVNTIETCEQALAAVSAEEIR